MSRAATYLFLLRSNLRLPQLFAFQDLCPEFRGMGKPSPPQNLNPAETHSPTRSASPDPSCLSCVSDFILPSVLSAPTGSPTHQRSLALNKISSLPNQTSTQLDSKSYPVTPPMLSNDSRPLTKSSPILIVGGGGTMGSSTALHLARRGYTNVRILDVYAIPSQQSAGFDLNKIAGGWYPS